MICPVTRPLPPKLHLKGHATSRPGGLSTKPSPPGLPPKPPPPAPTPIQQAKPEQPPARPTSRPQQSIRLPPTAIPKNGEKRIAEEAQRLQKRLKVGEKSDVSVKGPEFESGGNKPASGNYNLHDRMEELKQQIRKNRQAQAAKAEAEGLPRLELVAGKRSLETDTGKEEREK